MVTAVTVVGSAPQQRRRRDVGQQADEGDESAGDEPEVEAERGLKAEIRASGVRNRPAVFEGHTL
jgi:hypothetical protein